MSQLFKIRPSRILLFLLLFLYLVSDALVLILPIAVWQKLVLLMLLISASFYYLRKYALLLLPSSVIAVRIKDGDIFLITRDGQECSGVILNNSVVTPVMSILNVLLRGQARASSVVIFADCMEAERFRELRVILKWGDSNPA